ncbi:WD40-repeat-containing domain protein [Crucibulum laeve]|uniref:WD40-repeat-containing domain protein n=1 Tax=Crucibulum laeve TaxID=68775 RepID=A0A5C3LZ59_9AGAR|nr:WD40-repeat-containing domain protein [Crucibulum laeve]
MSSSTIYNHRTLQPTGPPAPGPSQQHSHARLNESFDVIRAEFDAMGQELAAVRTQRDELEKQVASQVNELNIIRQSLYDLESQHGKVRQSFEEELNRLRAELQHRAGPPAGILSHAPSGPGGTVGPGGPPAPPNAVPGTPSGSGPSSYNEPYYQRDRERDRERERDPRERDRMGDRERERGEPREQRDRERDREPRDRDRERERDRPTDQRDPKRLKSERIKTDRPDHFSPSLGPGPTPKLPPPPSSTAPPGVGPGLPPPPVPYPSAGPSSAIDQPPLEGTLVPIGNPANGGAFPDDLDIHAVPADLKREGSDWFAIFNPGVKRVLDVQLVHTLMHESVVCCVRFSADGKYLATGCNRTAQIYDTKTGQKTCVLIDEAAGKSGDLYIRSVCFSPDGRFLATGAEDKQIRIWDIAKKRIRNVFDGHQQEIYSLDFSTDGRLIVSGSGDKTARIWDMVDGSSKVLTINDPDSLNNDAGVTSVAISPNGQLVAAGSLDTVVRIWDVATGQLVERLRGHRDSVYSVAFTPEGKGLVSGSLDKTLKYWDVSGLMPKRGKEGQNGVSVSGPGASGAVVRKDADKSSQCTMNFTGHKDYVLSVAVSHDGQWVVSGSKDRGVQFWDSRSAIVQCMLQGHKNSVISIDLSPAGNTLATGSGDWQARIWSYGPYPQ